MSQHFVSRFGNQFVSSVSFNGATSTVTAASFVAQPGHTYQVIWNLVGDSGTSLDATFADPPVISASQLMTGVKRLSDTQATAQVTSDPGARVMINYTLRIAPLLHNGLEAAVISDDPSIILVEDPIEIP